MILHQLKEQPFLPSTKPDEGYTFPFMMFRIELLPCSHTNFTAAERTLNRPIIINPMKTPIQRTNEEHTDQPTETAAEPEYSRGDSFGIYKRNSQISPVLNPYLLHYSPCVARGQAPLDPISLGH